MTRHIQGPLGTEAAASRVECEIERAERRRRRSQKWTVIGAVVAGAVVFAFGASAMAGFGGFAASADAAAAAPVAPKTVATATAVGVPVDRPVKAPAKDAVTDRPANKPAPKAAASPGPRTPSGTAPSKVKARTKSKPVTKPKSPKKSADTTPQHFDIGIGGTGYDPSVVRASARRPITLTVAKGAGCAAGFNIPSLGVAKDNSSHPVTIKLGTVKPGSYTYMCDMGMVSGRLIVR